VTVDVVEEGCVLEVVADGVDDGELRVSGAARVSAPKVVAWERNKIVVQIRIDDKYAGEGSIHDKMRTDLLSVAVGGGREPATLPCPVGPGVLVEILGDAVDVEDAWGPSSWKWKTSGDKRLAVNADNATRAVQIRARQRPPALWQRSLVARTFVGELEHFGSGDLVDIQ
jgi:hypothetical protein